MCLPSSARPIRAPSVGGRSVTSSQMEAARGEGEGRGLDQLSGMVYRSETSACVSPGAAGRVGRRTEYTFKANAEAGRHAWLRLTAAYSRTLVEEILAAHGPTKRVFDPFCGTGTTALCAAYRGQRVVTVDINPFLVWFARAKTARYTSHSLAEADAVGRAALQLVGQRAVAPVSAPPIANIGRWWSPDSVEFLARLRAAIERLTPADAPACDLLLVAFCRTLIGLSNAAFNHQSMSFKDKDSKTENCNIDKSQLFIKNLSFILEGARQNPLGDVSVICGDSRRVGECVTERFDLVITSPPYANRVSYIRELRPYMYWLGFLTDGGQAGALDWEAIGGTWGSATSRLSRWRRSGNHFESELLDKIIENIKSKKYKSAGLISIYLYKYFDDLWAHFCQLPCVLNKGAELYYIIGNSSFYGVTVNTEQIVCDMLCKLKFTEIKCVPIRKRNSNKALVEFKVSARWG